jgi:hypothetical protein
MRLVALATVFPIVLDNISGYLSALFWVAFVKGSLHFSHSLTIQLVPLPSILSATNTNRLNRFCRYADHLAPSTYLPCAMQHTADFDTPSRSEIADCLTPWASSCFTRSTGTGGLPGM